MVNPNKFITFAFRYAANHYITRLMKLKYNILFQEVGDTWIGVAVGGDEAFFPGMLSFNETGYDIAHRLVNDTTKDILISQLLEEYDIDKPTLSEYVDEVLDYLKINKVI